MVVSGPNRGGRPTIQRKQYTDRDFGQLEADIAQRLENRDIAIQIEEEGTF